MLVFHSGELCRIYPLSISTAELTVLFIVTSENGHVTKSNEALAASLTCTALQWDTLAISDLVSWAAVEAVIHCCTDDAVGRTGFTPSPCRVEEPLWTDTPTLTLKEVSDHLKLV